MSRLLEQLRNAVGQQDSMLSEEQPDDMPAGMIFDLRFFGHIRGIMEELEQGRIDIPDWERRTRDIEQWMNNDPMVRAFEEEATKAKRVPLASRTFLDLAQRKVRRKANPRKANQRIPDSQRLPDFSEGCAVARAVLASTRTKDRWERDLHPDELSKHLAQYWLSRRNLDYLQFMIRGSEENTIYWNALELIGEAMAGKDVLGLKGNSPRAWTISLTHSSYGNLRLPKGFASALPRSPHLPIAPPR